MLREQRSERAPMPARKALWASRMLDMLMLAATLVATVGTEVAWEDGKELTDGTARFVLMALGWCMVSVLWSTVRVRRIRKARRGDERWARRLAGRRTIYLITLGTAVIVISRGLSIILASAIGPADNENVWLLQACSIIMVLLAWTMLHLAYAERYARMEMENTGPAHLDFPATAGPTLLEYAYFSFAVGTTFGTTDVTVQTSRMRGVVLCHGLLSFLYNTAILAVVLSLISG